MYREHGFHDFSEINAGPLQVRFKSVPKSMQIPFGSTRISGVLAEVKSMR